MVDLKSWKEQKHIKGREIIVHVFSLYGRKHDGTASCGSWKRTAGLFCAYLLAKYGYRPILIEQGAPAKERRKAVEDILGDRSS